MINPMRDKRKIKHNKGGVLNTFRLQYELLRNEKRAGGLRRNAAKIKKPIDLATRSGRAVTSRSGLLLAQAFHRFTSLVKGKYYSREEIRNIWSDEPFCNTKCRAKACVNARRKA